jgi:osmoprotectant transport system ATP-binding protein
VDADGVVLGVVRGGEVLALIEEARQVRQAAL